MSDDLLALSAAEAGARVRDGELSAAELFEFWRGRAAGRRARVLPLGGR